MTTREYKLSALKNRKEEGTLSLSKALWQYTVTTSYFTHKSMRKYILSSNSPAGRLSEATILHSFFCIRVCNITIFLSSCTHLSDNYFPAFIWLLWDTLTLNEVSMDLPGSEGHLWSGVKGTPAVGKQAVQVLVIPACHEATLCKSTLQGPAGGSVPERFSVSHRGEGVSTSFVSHAELLRARGQGFPPPHSVQRDMLNICKGHEIRCNREREG